MVLQIVHGILWKNMMDRVRRIVDVNSSKTQLYIYDGVPGLSGPSTTVFCFKIGEIILS
jgi:hypothetical protein